MSTSVTELARVALAKSIVQTINEQSNPHAVAHAVGTSHTTIYRYCTGERSPKRADIRKIEESLGLEPGTIDEFAQQILYNDLQQSLAA